MSRRTFSLVAGVVFGLIALGHMLRIVLGWSFTIQNCSVPMWPSALAVVIFGYLAYEGFRLARKSWPEA
jgi:threonine/homoserine/homoserine lactone efflux protein